MNIAKRSLQTTFIRGISQSRVVLSDLPKDNFSSKERAQENVYVKQKETEQLKALREKVEKQQKTIDDLKLKIKKA